MPNPVAHFEIYGDDPSRLAEFYQKLFGWNVTAIPEMEYWLIQTVPIDEKGVPTAAGGINGGLMKRPNPDARAWFNYVSVASLDEAVDKLLTLGGSVIRPKSAVPKNGWFAVVMDPQMNVFGIWQDDPSAA